MCAHASMAIFHIPFTDFNVPLSYRRRVQDFSVGFMVQGKIKASLQVVPCNQFTFTLEGIDFVLVLILPLTKH